MLVTQLKSKEELLTIIKKPAFVIKCTGCKEVLFPVTEIDEFLKTAEITVSDIISTDYICNTDFALKLSEKYKSEISNSLNIIVFSCGIGVQSISALLENKKVISGCDTLYINGFQGLNTRENNCRQCGQCYLSETGGICPITACSKSLLNGQCGGAKNGKCEVSKEMECGWERIYKRLELIKETQKLTGDIKVRDYLKLL
ncbi:MAG: hypothetical protein A2252_06980 [Elusimicrobia bacterium RIFOXYA2_FULL_39_19]|nr:MAG: hypothetical protein A2252_06980 [Elusimicrobia bacterium RIFOXYA2_FULL_39_19]